MWSYVPSFLALRLAGDFPWGATRKNVEWDMRVCTKITISIVELVSNTTVAIGLAINDALVWSGNLTTLK